MGAEDRLHWRVEGMDCAACVASVTRAVERLPGVSAVEVNLMAERLSLSLAPGTTPAEAIGREVEALGYAALPLAPPGAGAVASRDAGRHDHGGGHDHGPGHHHHHHDHDHDHDDPGQPWWRAAKARLVWVLGAVVCGAYVLGLVLPERFGQPLFVAATAVAVIPFARRAVALARAGSWRTSPPAARAPASAPSAG